MRGAPDDDAARAALQAAAGAALDDQALPKRYAHGLAGRGALLWGVAFDGSKRVAVSCARLE